MEGNEALAICRKAVSLSKSDDVVARLEERSTGATRFANNAITQSVAERKANLSIRVAFGKRRGTVAVNRFEEDELAAAVARAEAIARVAPEDEEHLPPVEPGEYPAVPEGDPAVLAADPEARAGAVAKAVAAAGGNGIRAAGAYTTEGGFAAFANSRGAQGLVASTHATVHATALTDTSSGWSAEVSQSLSDVDPERAARRAGELARLAADPREVEPGEYEVVLAPPAVTEMLAFLLWSMDAKAADEGRSALSGKEGERIGSDRVTLRSVLADPALPGQPFDAEGAPTRDVTWVEGGVLRTLHTTRFWAGHSGRPYTPFPGTISMEGSDAATEELIGRMDRGLYVTRFWYTRHVDPMRLLLTGMTRDALFLVEGGRIVSGVKHLRYNDSPLRVLERTVETGRPEPAWMYARGRVPALRVEGFRFTSGTSF